MQRHAPRGLRAFQEHGVRARGQRGQRASQQARLEAEPTPVGDIAPAPPAAALATDAVAASLATSAASLATVAAPAAVTALGIAAAPGGGMSHRFVLLLGPCLVFHA
jgi:hypothetical protein